MWHTQPAGVPIDPGVGEDLVRPPAMHQQQVPAACQNVGVAGLEAQPHQVQFHGIWCLVSAAAVGIHQALPALFSLHP